MKKSFVALLCVFLSIFQFASAETDSELLQQKLAKFNVIQADFFQTVTSPEGQTIQENVGELTISRPGNFHWKVTSPEEELIVSNGKDMWLFSPFIEQVTIMNFTDAIAGTPFALLSGADKSAWSNFNVKQVDNKFIVTNKEAQTNTNIFTFVFDDKDGIKEFIVQEQQGQKSVFQLSNKQYNVALANDYFEFKIPAGVEVDDQR